MSQDKDELQQAIAELRTQNEQLRADLANALDAEDEAVAQVAQSHETTRTAAIGLTLETSTRGYVVLLLDLHEDDVAEPGDLLDDDEPAPAIDALCVAAHWVRPEALQAVIAAAIATSANDLAEALVRRHTYALKALREQEE